MATLASLSLTIIDRDGKRPLATAADVAPALLELTEVAVTEGSAAVVYDVVGRRIAVDATGRLGAELQVTKRARPLADRLGESVVSTLASVLVTLLAFGAIALWYALSSRLEATIGWAVAHADWVAGATVFIYFQWRALSSRDRWLQAVCGLGAIPFGFLALVFVQVQALGSADPAWQRSQDYGALGADVLAHREQWLSALAVYAPTILLVLRFAGLARAADALERLGLGKGKK